MAKERYNKLTRVELFDSEYLADKSDSFFINSVIIPKLKERKEVSILCSFSYFTANYTDMFLFHQLSELVKHGCSLYLLMWDINAQSHPYFVKIINERHIAPEQMIQEKMGEVLSILSALGTPMSRIHVYRASEMLSRFIKKQSPNLFVKYYEVAEKMNLNMLVLKHKVSHLLQMPLDLFFAYYLQELYPEDMSQPIEAMVCYDYQYEIYAGVRSVLHEKALGKSVKPALLMCRPHPYLVREGALPEIGMSQEALVQHVLACNPSEQEILQMYEVVIASVLKECELFTRDKKVSLFGFDEFMRKNKALPKHNQQVSLGHNLYRYLQFFETKLDRSTTQRIVHLESMPDTVKFARLLSRKRLVQILQNVDGTTNATQLAKQLQIARSNLSNYLKMLRKNGFITIDSEGFIHKNISAISMNFELGLKQ